MNLKNFKPGPGRALGDSSTPPEVLRARLIAVGATPIAASWRVDHDPARRVVDPTDRARSIVADLDHETRRALAAELVAVLGDYLATTGPRWLGKVAAARELGVTVECVRARCDRAASPVPTKWTGARELVDVNALRRDLDASPPRNPAKPRRRADSRGDDPQTLRDCV